MPKLIVQLVCLLVVALILSDGNKWNDATNPVDKFYCEVDHLRNVSVELFKHVSYSYSICTYGNVFHRG